MKMKEAKIIRPTSQVMDVEPKVGDEDGQLDWQKAISAWERTEQKGILVNAAIRHT